LKGLKKGRFKLSKAERISAGQDFNRIFKEGKRIRFPEFTLVIAANDKPFSRMGISVGRRFGNAVKRNRAKRLCRELFRLQKPAFPQGFDLVFLPRQEILETGWQKLRCRMNEAGKIVEKRFAVQTKNFCKSGCNNNYRPDQGL